MHPNASQAMRLVTRTRRHPHLGPGVARSQARRDALEPLLRRARQHSLRSRSTSNPALRHVATGSAQNGAMTPLGHDGSDSPRSSCRCGTPARSARPGVLRPALQARSRSPQQSSQVWTSAPPSRLASKNRSRPDPARRARRARDVSPPCPARRPAQRARTSMSWSGCGGQSSGAPYWMSLSW